MPMLVVFIFVMCPPNGRTHLRSLLCIRSVQLDVLSDYLA